MKRKPKSRKAFPVNLPGLRHGLAMIDRPQYPHTLRWPTPLIPAPFGDKAQEWFK